MPQLTAGQAAGRVAAPRRMRAAPRSRRAARVTATMAAPKPASSSSSALPYGRVFNFSAGPAMLPQDVLEKARDNMLNWHGSGMSVMEMSHRGKEFESIIKKAEADLRKLMNIPDNYKVLFLQGGASTQFAAIPMNFAGPDDAVDYIVTGAWSKKAQEEAGKYNKKVGTAAKGDNKSLPTSYSWTEGAKYVHYCDNETIGGVEYKAPPPVAPGAALIADMSSNFLSKPVDVSKYAMIYGGAQKNIGPSGVTICIIRDDLLARGARPTTPTMLDYAAMAKDASLYNTPPCWSIYVCGLVFEKLLAEGGLSSMAASNAVKADLLYGAIDGSGGYYVSPVHTACRSAMNVPFVISPAAAGAKDLEKAFIKEAEKEGMLQLAGHRSVGGMRASIYNAMPMEGVQKLVAFMKDFQARNKL